MSNGNSRTARAAPVSIPSGIRGIRLAGPFPIGDYTKQLQQRLQKMTRVQVFGEVNGLGIRDRAVYFELRDGKGAVSCAMWRNVYDKWGVDLENGMQVVVAGGPDYSAHRRPGAEQAGAARHPQ